MVWCKHSINSFTKQLFKRTQCWLQIDLKKKTLRTKRNKNTYKRLFTDGNKIILAIPNWSISFLFGSMIFMNLSCIAKTEYPFLLFFSTFKVKHLHYSPEDIFPLPLIETNASTGTSISTASTLCLQGLFFCFKRQTHSIKCSFFRSDAIFTPPGICWSLKAWTFVFKCHKQPPRRALLIHFTGFQNAILCRRSTEQSTWTHSFSCYLHLLNT